MRALDRRTSYAGGLQNRDYFVVRHLGRFLTAQVGRFVGRDTRVLDVGCGGQPLRAAVEARGGSYVGLDLAPGRGGPPPVVGSVLDLPLRASSFDVVLCSEVIEHVSDTRRALRELARVVRPGGRVVVTTPFLYPLHEEPSDFVRLTPHQLAACARDGGLEVDEIGCTGDELQVVATVLDNLWTRSLPADAGVVPRALGVVWRVAWNAAALVASGLLGARLPRKSFLSVVAVLRRPTGVAGQPEASSSS